MFSMKIALIIIVINSSQKDVDILWTSFSNVTAQQEIKRTCNGWRLPKFSCKNESQTKLIRKTKGHAPPIHPFSARSEGHGSSLTVPNSLFLLPRSLSLVFRAHSTPNEHYSPFDYNTGIRERASGAHLSIVVDTLLISKLYNPFVPICGGFKTMYIFVEFSKN